MLCKEEKVSKAVHKGNVNLLDSKGSWEQSVSDKLKKSWAKVLFVKLRPNELFSDYSVAWKG